MREGATSNAPEANTHIFVLSRGKIAPQEGKKNKNTSTCVSALGVKCVCLNTHTHTSICNVHAGC